MKSPDYQFADLIRYLSLIRRYPNAGWIFRGQGDVSLPLLPKAGRPDYFQNCSPNKPTEDIQQQDLGRFLDWREQAIAYCDKLPENDFECLAYAQHYGLATRLLDWTTNSLVALYFAAEDQSQQDGAVFCHLGWQIVDYSQAKLGKINQVAHFIPRPFDRRILVQSGVFTYHPNPNQPLEPHEANPEMNKIAPEGIDLVVLHFPADTKPILLRQLRDVGISRKTLFPDLDGLSGFINWQTRRSAKWVAENPEPQETSGFG